MSKILRLNMTFKTTRYEEMPIENQLYGGRGLIAKILNDEVDPKCDPLGPENKLIVCIGLLGDTNAPCAARLSIGGKSPLTGGVKEANSGGIVGSLLAKLGLKAVVIDGKPAEDRWFVLKISKDKAELLDGTKYQGMDNYQLTEELRNDFGPKIGAVSIGRAGERGYRNSSLQVTDPIGRPCRAAARGGLGAVMGSKRIKAIIVEAQGSKQEEIIDKERFSSAAKNYVKAIKDTPFSGQVLPTFGTPILVNVINSFGALPTNNYSLGQFDRAEDISGERIQEIQKSRNGKNHHVCTPGCVIGCSLIYNDENGNYLTSGLEYETVALNGSNCGISSLDAIAKIDRLCDDLGVDTMETGCSLAVCMEAGIIPFGDEESVFRLLKEMKDGTEFGKALGKGTEFIGKKLGVARIPTVKGQSLAAYDPRSLKGTGITYATSPMGADHTAGNTFGLPGIDPHKKEGQIAASQNSQTLMALFDCLGMCLFSSLAMGNPEGFGILTEMLEAKFGGKWTPEAVMGIAANNLALERKFNEAAGFTSDDDKLPDFMYQESLAPANTVFDFSSDELAQVIVPEK